MLVPPEKFNAYCKQVADYLRAREANVLRGQPARLQQLDQITDLDLLKKWSWMSAIVGAIVTFAGMPLGLMIVKIFMPALIMNVLWLLTKFCMAVSCALFALAAYFTFFTPKDNQGG